jgi:hypothetical protein
MKTITVKLYKFSELSDKAKERAVSSYMASDRNSPVFEETNRLVALDARSELNERGIEVMDIEVTDNLDGAYIYEDPEFVGIAGIFLYEGIQLRTGVRDYYNGTDNVCVEVTVPVLPILVHPEDADRADAVVKEFKEKFWTVVEYCKRNVFAMEQQAAKNLREKMDKLDEVFTKEGRHVSKDEIKKLKGYE